MGGDEIKWDELLLRVRNVLLGIGMCVYSDCIGIVLYHMISSVQSVQFYN